MVATFKLVAILARVKASLIKTSRAKIIFTVSAEAVVPHYTFTTVSYFIRLRFDTVAPVGALKAPDIHGASSTPFDAFF